MTLLLNVVLLGETFAAEIFTAPGVTAELAESSNSTASPSI